MKIFVTGVTGLFGYDVANELLATHPDSEKVLIDVKSMCWMDKLKARRRRCLSSQD